MSIKKILPMAAVFATAMLAASAFSAGTASAADVTPDASLTARVGLGQESARSPAMLGNLKLDDPLVQKKYLNEPDMMRFLRGTYSEACSRGLMAKAATQIKMDIQRQYPPEAR